jgi:glutaredoxin 3
MPKVLMYCTKSCPYCTRAEKLLNKKGVDVEKIDASDPAVWKKMEKLTKRNTVPQIYIGDFHVGGFDDLYDMDVAGKIDKLLAS